MDELQEAIDEVKATGLMKVIFINKIEIEIAIVPVKNKIKIFGTLELDNK